MKMSSEADSQTAISTEPVAERTTVGTSETVTESVAPVDPATNATPEAAPASTVESAPEPQKTTEAPMDSAKTEAAAASSNEPAVEKEEVSLLRIELNLLRCPKAPIYKTRVPVTSTLRDLFTELHQAWPFGSSVPQVDVTHIAIVFSGKRYSITTSTLEELNQPFSQVLLADHLVKNDLALKGMAFLYEPTASELEFMRARDAGLPTHEMCGGWCTIA